MTFSPSVSPDIFELRPDFVALSIHVQDAKNMPSDDHSLQLLRAACQQPSSTHWAQGHYDSWTEAYRAFGAKPHRTPCSATALRKRADRDGGIPRVNAVVDLYNALSLRYAIPIGGEDAQVYDGSPMLVRASGGEAFDTIAEGVPKVESVERGEVIWRDNKGATCRRWNWRQGIRTRITESSTAMWFVFERLDPMPVAAVMEAGAQLIEGLRRLSSGLLVSQHSLDRSNCLGAPL